jgi:hypothetical protein
MEIIFGKITKVIPPLVSICQVAEKEIAGVEESQKWGEYRGGYAHSVATHMIFFGGRRQILQGSLTPKNRVKEIPPSPF